MSPLSWERWIRSPSGRDMPFAATLRAHPKFAQIWQNREDLIAREKARYRMLHP